MSNVTNPSTAGGTHRPQDQAREKASELKAQASEMAARAKEAAQETLGELKESATEYVERGRERVSELGDTIESRIREQPMKAVLIAAGVGFVLGMCWTRR
jgi:ElaB/YqjD/DUF883 family membrane-anchored ribosome-binding protein